KANLLTKITDGLGNEVSLDWEPLSATDLGSSAPTGFEPKARGPYVVASVARNDGVGGTYSVSTAYHSPLGRVGGGFAGFKSTVMLDSRTLKTVGHTYKFGKYVTGLLTNVKKEL